MRNLKIFRLLPRPSYLAVLLKPLISQEPAAKLIRKTARQQWRLIAINLVSSMIEAFSEGATLGVVFLAVQVLSVPIGAPFNWQTNGLLKWSPTISGWLNSLAPTTIFVGLLALAVLLQALQSLTRFIGQVSVAYFAARCRALVTMRIYNQVLSFSFPCASAYKVGDLIDYAANGPEALRLQIELSGGLLVSGLLCATYLMVLVGISPWLLLAVGLMGGTITLVQHQLLPRIRQGSEALTRIQVLLGSRIMEDFQGLRLLHSTGQLGAASRQLSAGMGELERQLRVQGRRLSFVGPFSSFLPILAIAVIGASSLLLLGNRSSGVLPSLVTFVLSLQRLNTRLGGIAITINQLTQNSAQVSRLNKILSPDGKHFRRFGGVAFTGFQRQIQFENVSLRYAPGLPSSLLDISFILPKGSTIALVGPSGAGKSSIADLLIGLYSPNSGHVWIDDTCLDCLDLECWQQRLGVVSQDTFLLNATIAENIAFGTLNATQAQIEAASHAAQAAEFIENLPLGYDTLVGERGYRLSGGQRQRLSLARAILRDPELLILDEATSALDTQTEQLVLEAIEHFEHSHTVLVIAHRLSTIVRADQILVMDQGHVVEQGTHSSLIAHGGLYSQLWQQQIHANQTAHI